MEKIIFKKEVLEYFDELFFILFEQQYFSFEDNAQNYIDKIVEFICENIETFPHQPAPKQLKHLGSKYIFYKANSRTVWYVFFENKENKYLITGITNSHSENIKHIKKT